jgi:4-aminobutyrate aminotransferase
VPTASFFPALRELCDRHKILLIVDEVQSGMGRTGKWWAIEHFGIEPDIVCSAKGIASGVPLGVMFAKEHIVTWQKGAHGNTYGGNPLACAAALATMELIENEYLQNANEMGEYMMDILEEIQVRHPSIGQVRGKGLMIGVEFVKDRFTKEPDPKLRDRIVDHAFVRGLLLLGCGSSVIRFAPPLSVTRSEIDESMEIFEDAIRVSENTTESYTGEAQTVAP